MQIKLKNSESPFWLWGGGAQAALGEDVKGLAEAIKPEATRFIDSVHATGGIFGLRGYFTKELFDYYGYKDDVVIGCPSMYQRGRNLKIHKESSATIIPAFNGSKLTISRFRKEGFFEKYPSSVFVDQGEYINILYNHYYEKISFRKMRSIARGYTMDEIKLLSEGRVVCLYDLPILAQELINRGINFSFGQRIHGNILCTLLEIPSVVAYCDSRTHEIAEYFDIPMYYLDETSSIDLEEIYSGASWGKFNDTFPDKFDKFDKLLMSYGIPSIRDRKVDFFLEQKGYHWPEYQNDLKDIGKWIDTPLKQQLTKLLKY